MISERFGAVASKDKKLTVLGDIVKIGDRAPNFTLRNRLQEDVMLTDSAGKVRLVSVVPSLDTGLCEMQTIRFNQEADKFGDDVVFYTVSAEHPFNQKRWCAATGVDKLEVLSDHLDMNFGLAYGTWIKEWRLEQRSVFVINNDDVITYVEYVPVIGQHPDYDSALEAVRKLTG